MRILLCFILLFSSYSKAEQPLTPKPNVLLFMSSHTEKVKGELLTSLTQDLPFNFVIYSAKGKPEEQIKQDWANAKLVMLDGTNPALSKFMFDKYLSYPELMPNTPVISLGDLDNNVMNHGLTAKQQADLGQYYNNGGRQNYRNMMLYISNRILANNPNTEVEPALVIPNVGVYHPNYKSGISADELAFFNWLNADQDQAVIAIAIHRSVLDYEQSHVVDSIIKKLETKGAKAFAFFFEGNDEALPYPELLKDENGNTRLDLMINYRSLHYVEKRRAEFESLGVPVIHALNYSDGDQAQYEKDHAGVSPALMPFFLVMPEDTGSTDPIVITANDQGQKKVIDYQLNALVERAYNHARLGHIANKDKKVATFIWNYPPGEKNIGAAFLDVPSSIENIATAMAEQGYQIEQMSNEDIIKNAGLLLRPYYRDEDPSQLIELGLADFLPVTTYLDWFNALPESVKSPIIARWGKPEESIKVVEHNGTPSFIIPRMNLGNLIVLPQGLRGESADEQASLYHDMKTPANHSYLAIYLYVRKIFGADALIHLGTHGSQEWLEGKERGLSVYDSPNLAIGQIPVFYPYIIDNVGEAMQAKRRGRATMISHLTPGFAKAGLYAEVANLSDKITDYLMLSDGQTKANTKKQIIKLAQELNILNDLQMSPSELDQDFEANIAQLRDHLTALAQMSQPLGVHTFGDLPPKAHLITTMLQMLGEDFTSRAALLEQDMGLTLPASLQTINLAVAPTDEQLSESEKQVKVENLEALAGYQLLNTYLTTKSLPAIEDKKRSEQLAIDLKQVDEYWHNFNQIAEIKNLLAALQGQYISVSHGGDPIRNPQAAPTGRNLIGFNPAKVPSKEAYDAGVTLMDQTISDYYSKHGKYPEKLAFSLWSLETMRHQGALEAQILHALGLKPKWNNQGNVTGTEIIPMSELKRPRIDVVISATGLYRDAFPNVILWLAEAIDKIAQMKEDNNFVYRHSQLLKTNLLEQGQTEDDAKYLSSVRIFSNETGNYGTGLAASSLASDTWQEDSKLANVYLKRMGYAFGKDEKRWSENVGSIGKQGLYANVLSGTDAAVFSRSTNLYALLTNDDPFQYFGGLGLAVRNLDGKTPEMYVSNLRKKDHLKTQTLEQFVNQEMRSRYFHPRWIKAMQDSGYAGATAIFDRMNNMWGWEVMTPDAIRDDQWQEFFDIYVNDKYQMNMRNFFEQHNAEALAQIVERMLEAVRKEYWQPDQATIQKMVETYTEIAAEFDVESQNETFKEYVNQQAFGFGLTPLPAALDMANPATKTAANASKQVTGQKLEQQVVKEAKDKNYPALWGLLTIFLLGILFGGQRKPKPANNTLFIHRNKTNDSPIIVDEAA